MRILFTSLLFLFAFSAYAQEADLQDLNKTPNYTPGIELQKAANTQFVNLTVGVLGGAATFLLFEGGNPQAGYAVAGLTTLGSIVLHVYSWNHVKRAGEMLENRRLSMGLRNHGVGLAFSLN